jgi:HdeA/HdeB family protein
MARKKTLLLVACALLALAAGKPHPKPPPEIDATKVTCATYNELGANRQKRILAFLQGYAHRELAQDKVGSVAIGAGLSRVKDACAKDAGAPAWPKVRALASDQDAGARGDARLTRPPTEITCRAWLKLDREDRRMTVYWLDGYSRKVDETDANQSVVSLDSDPEVAARNACGKRKQSLWSAIQGSVRSVDPAPTS